MKQSDLKVTSCVKEFEGAPVLFVNGKPVPGAAYITYYMHNNRYRDFAAAGYSLYSLPVFFAERTINEKSGIPPFTEGIFEGDEPNFERVDRDIHDILAARPDAFIFPRVNTTLPKKWDKAHPDELCDTAQREDKCVCYSSDEWAKEVKRCIKVFVEHVMASDYAEHIVGYQVAGGNTEEWFSFDAKGSVGKRSREGFEKYRAKNGLVGTEDEYYRYLSYVTAKRVCEFAACFKEATENRLAVGAFYGYTMETVDRTTCHHAANITLCSESIDFICSPVSYFRRQFADHDHANMMCIDSVKLHGKLYFAENDTRTDLSRAANSLPHYNLPVWFGPDRETSKAIIKQHFARVVAHGHACWWFDMWGGWYDSPDYMEIMKKCCEIAAQSLLLPKKSSAKLAVFVDERVYSYFDAGDDTAVRVCYGIRDALGKTAVPYDVYLADDFEEVKERYKAFMFLIPRETELMTALVADAENTGTPYLIINSDNAAVSSDGLREFCRGAGITPYFDCDAVVYENESYFFAGSAVTDVALDVSALPFGLENAFTGEKPSVDTIKAGDNRLYKKIR